jgi:hypothetical protein
VEEKVTVWPPLPLLSILMLAASTPLREENAELTLFLHPPQVTPVISTV